MSAEEVYIDPHDLYQTLSTSLWLGAGAPKLSNLLTGQVVGQFAIEAAQNNYTFTEDSLIAAFGTRPEDASILLALFGGGEGLAQISTIIAYQILPYVPHPTNTSAVLPLFIVFTILTTIVIGLRLWSRYKVAGGIKSFDWMALLGYLTMGFYGGYAAFYDKSWNALRDSYEAKFVLETLYPFAIMAIKLSLLNFFFCMTTWTIMRYSVLATALLVIGNTLAAFLTLMFQCANLDFWDHQFAMSCRINPQKFNIAMSAIYIATDVIIWILPMPLVFQLKLYPRERILAVFTFSLGAIACIASCFRLHAVTKYMIYTEQSSSSLIIDAWTIVELNLALICASAPAVRALAIHYAPKLLSSRASSPDGSSRRGERIPSRNTSVGSESKKSLDSSLKMGLETKVTADTGNFETVEIAYDHRHSRVNSREAMV
ncbi:hypothetical protein ABW19_dt0202014 [Dactylella cylindrospora]|nr:hypothetical protein ABW19_dt0202014 [Dactylella cylindrospora]